MEDPTLQAESPADNSAGQPKLSALMPPERVVTPADGARVGALADRPAALCGVAIPGRDRQTRRKVLELHRENSHLPGAARAIVASYVQLAHSAGRIYSRWRLTDFAAGRDGELFLRVLSELRRHAVDLGLTPA